jgi:hypothetical protein
MIEQKNILAAGAWLRRNPCGSLKATVAALKQRFRLSTAAELQAAILYAGRRGLT